MKTASASIGNKPQQDNSGNITNMGVQKTLPPGVKSNATFGNLFLDMGELHWLTYDGKNFLEDYGKGPKIQDLYANFRFWGEDPNSKGIFLKFKNGMKQKRETATTKYRYVINCPEPAFERYIDDMGALVVNFYSVQEGLTIGTSKVIVKLYIKRHKQPGDMAPIIELRGTFPITLIGDLDYKIGEFSFALTSSFTNATT